jgi:hypothetical protein
MCQSNLLDRGFNIYLTIQQMLANQHFDINGIFYEVPSILTETSPVHPGSIQSIHSRILQDHYTAEFLQD